MVVSFKGWQLGSFLSFLLQYWVSWGFICLSFIHFSHFPDCDENGHIMCPLLDRINKELGDKLIIEVNFSSDLALYITIFNIISMTPK